MNRIWVCGRWPLRTEAKSLSEAIEVGGNRTIKHEKRIQHLSANAWALHHALQIVQSRKTRRRGTVVDLCAGIGLWASIIEDELHPEHLWLSDLDPGCCASLRKSFPKAEVAISSYNDMKIRQADLVCMDITICTATRVFQDKPTVPLVEMLKENITWILISDCAAPKLHLNAKHYGKVLGTDPTDYIHYVELYSDELLRRTGASIHTAIYTSNNDRPHSCYFLITDFFGPVRFRKLHSVPPTTFNKKEGLMPWS